MRQPLMHCSVFRNGNQHYIWVYRHDQVREAVDHVNDLPARDENFSKFDAAIVTAAIRRHTQASEDDCWRFD